MWREFLGRRVGTVENCLESVWKYERMQQQNIRRQTVWMVAREKLSVRERGALLITLKLMMTERKFMQG